MRSNPSAKVNRASPRGAMSGVPRTIPAMPSPSLTSRSGSPTFLCTGRPRSTGAAGELKLQGLPPKSSKVKQSQAKASRGRSRSDCPRNEEQGEAARRSHDDEPEEFGLEPKVRTGQTTSGHSCGVSTAVLLIAPNPDERRTRGTHSLAKPGAATGRCAAASIVQRHAPRRSNLCSSTVVITRRWRGTNDQGGTPLRHDKYKGGGMFMRTMACGSGG